VDVTDEASIAAAAHSVAQAVGEAGLAGLVNNAGVGVPGPIELIAANDLRRQFEINVFGQVLVTQAFLPLIRQAQGRIINIGSVGGKITMPFGGALCASKYALEAINDALRLELHPWGIHVILVAPASISTPAVDREKTGSSPEVVAQTVLKALTAKTPKTRYPIGANAKTLTLMSQILPARRLDKIRFKLFGLPQKFRIWTGSDQSKTAKAVSLWHEISS
jgi:NAD(P)-dependent dehydrogenase (short-subunit alcohol dehydrogenase family)